jgi:hypothetical protein
VSVFISYARRDTAAVEQLRTDIERCRRHVWFDREVTGGHRWWTAILQQIRGCDVFVFTLSPDSVKSRACRAELEYAEALGRPILPIMLRDVNIHWAPRTVSDTQIVDYRNRTADSVFALRDALDLLPAPPPLPDPLPPEPEIPTSYLDKVINQLNLDELSLRAQTDLFVQLRSRMEDEDERDDVRPLLVRLRGRADLAQSLVPDIDRTLATYPSDGAGQPPPSPGRPNTGRPSAGRPSAGRPGAGSNLGSPNAGPPNSGPPNAAGPPNAGPRPHATTGAPPRQAAPAPPIPGPPPEARPVGWYGDPFKRVSQRYWNGQIWTTMVRHGGEEYDERTRPQHVVPPTPKSNSTVTAFVIAGAVTLLVLFLVVVATA